MNEKATDNEFIEAWNILKSASAVSKKLGIELRAVYNRRRTLENKYKIRLIADHKSAPEYYVRDYNSRMDVDIDNATIFVASDAHYWPDSKVCGVSFTE